MTNEPTFRHLDDADMPWQQVKAQRNADGSESAVWEKWLAFSADPLYLCLYARYDPGMIVRRHGHHSPHVVFVLEGDVRIGDRTARAGTHIELPARSRVRADRGRTGRCRALRGDDGRPASWGDEPGAVRGRPRRHGADARCPTRRSTIPPWLADLRTHWV